MYKLGNISTLVFCIIWITGQTTAICSTGWVSWTDSGNEKCYLPVADIGTYSQAKAHCTDQGAHMVVIDSEEENNFVFSQLGVLESSPGVAYKSFWLGADSLSGPYRFLDPVNGGYDNGHMWEGSAVFDGYWNWWPGEPAHVDQNCAAMPINYDGTWSDEDCENNVYIRSVLCESIGLATETTTGQQTTSNVATTTNPTTIGPTTIDPTKQQTHDNRPHDDRPHDNRPHDDRPHDNRPHDNRPHDDRPHDNRPHDNRPHDDIPHDNRPTTTDPTTTDPTTIGPTTTDPTTTDPTTIGPTTTDPTTIGPTTIGPTTTGPTTTESKTTESKTTASMTQPTTQPATTGGDIGESTQVSTESLSTIQESPTSHVTVNVETQGESQSIQYGQYKRLGRYCLLGNLLFTVTAVSPTRCAAYCQRNKLCLSFSFLANKQINQCRLHSTTKDDEGVTTDSELSAGQTCWYYEEI
ncbi:putative macrophage mannose receptor 1-like [Apostichopus japonicus]|uniref:Putative macrophage mannose receptor 1-like n=1 Tax=Stichopus japonicus TaxID=307972 RepID=A0A2G8K0N1_STIJA|nr:putative macrophage mannose receptor 1-like [Apostichopus japonicus]